MDNNRNTTNPGSAEEIRVKFEKKLERIGITSSNATIWFLIAFVAVIVFRFLRMTAAKGTAFYAVTNLLVFLSSFAAVVLLLVAAIFWIMPLIVSWKHHMSSEDDFPSRDQFARERTIFRRSTASNNSDDNPDALDDDLDSIDDT